MIFLIFGCATNIPVCNKDEYKELNNNIIEINNPKWETRYNYWGGVASAAGGGIFGYGLNFAILSVDKNGNNGSNILSSLIGAATGYSIWYLITNQGYFGLKPNGYISTVSDNNYSQDYWINNFNDNLKKIKYTSSNDKTTSLTLINKNINNDNFKINNIEDVKYYSIIFPNSNEYQLKEVFNKIFNIQGTKVSTDIIDIFPKNKQTIIDLHFEQCNTIKELYSFSSTYPSEYSNADNKAYEICLNLNYYGWKDYLQYFPRGHYSNLINEKVTIYDCIEKFKYDLHKCDNECDIFKRAECYKSLYSDYYSTTCNKEIHADLVNISSKYKILVNSNEYNYQKRQSAAMKIFYTFEGPNLYILRPYVMSDNRTGLDKMFAPLVNLFIDKAYDVSEKRSNVFNSKINENSISFEENWGSYTENLKLPKSTNYTYINEKYEIIFEDLSVFKIFQNNYLVINIAKIYDKNDKKEFYMKFKINFSDIPILMNLLINNKDDIPELWQTLKNYSR